MKKIFFILLTFSFLPILQAQTQSISGKITSQNINVAHANIVLQGTNWGTVSDSLGNFKLENIKPGTYRIKISRLEYSTLEKNVSIKSGVDLVLNVELASAVNTLNEVVISGTQKASKRLDSPVNVEVYSPVFFKKNPTPSIFESLQNVNGVRPQVNCSVCNTGDIHINGLEGAYTMILIDGMPIVSSLSTVYGISGIPNSLVERIEIVKGPASSLYGSEAVGGLINIITKNPKNAPSLAVDVLGTSWQEANIDIANKWNVTPNTSVLTGINYFNFNNIVDNNADNFTDMTLQNRISIFQKWNFVRKNNKTFSIAARYLGEERWGGELNWNKSFRGGDSIYGESIYTKRLELIGNYQLPFKEKIMLSYSFNRHLQDSRYGTTSFVADQMVGFSQLTWDKTIGKNDLLLGLAARCVFYDDNTPATALVDTSVKKNNLQQNWLPGVFFQNEFTFSHKHKMLLGLRLDHNSVHGNIFTPRFAYKFTLDNQNVFRLNFGTGFRVVNLFSEDHAALTRSRIVDIKNNLKPEKSLNLNLNYIKKIYTVSGKFIGLDASIFYTYFYNRIVGDFETDPNKIIYDNLQGFAQSKGISLNSDITFPSGLKCMLGATLMENSLTENGLSQQQLLSENFSGTWAISYAFSKMHLAIDYTGNLHGPMRLPTLGGLDPRKPFSPWWSIQNVQLVYSKFKNLEIYGGVKNLLNWTPSKERNPFIIARSDDPFDRKIQTDSNGKIVANSSNPYALSFDPSYVYAPMQGLRMFFGIRMSLK
ncbi:MAG: TonB-dependent receptor [Pseudarcicella sp.]|nr:TonB-dependent receptor [Pseudarcicella sp.]